MEENYIDNTDFIVIKDKRFPNAYVGFFNDEWVLVKIGDPRVKVFHKMEDVDKYKEESGKGSDEFNITSEFIPYLHYRKLVK